MGLVLVALFAPQCRRADAPSSTSPSTASTPGPTSSPAGGGAPAALVAPPSAEPSSRAVGQDEPASGTFARVTERYRENDLRLLAEVQRITGGPAPDSIERLIALRREQGADAAALKLHIDTRISGLSLEVAARRWLARELGVDAPPTHPPGSGAPAVATPTRRVPD